MRRSSCCSSLDKIQCFIWPVLLWHLHMLSEGQHQWFFHVFRECTPHVSRTAPNTLACVCFPLCCAYAAHMQRTEMWCRDTDVIAPFASCGFEVERFLAR